VSTEVLYDLRHRADFLGMPTFSKTHGFRTVWRRVPIAARQLKSA